MEQQQPRSPTSHQRPREAESVTFDELPDIEYNHGYYDCDWPSDIGKITVDFSYEILTVGLEPDWSRRAEDLTGAVLLDALNYQIPKSVEHILGIEGCDDKEDEVELDGNGKRKLANLRRGTQEEEVLEEEAADEEEQEEDYETGILQIGAGERDVYDAGTVQCTEFTKVEVDIEGTTACTPMKGHVEVVYGPSITDSEVVSKRVLDAISQTMAGGGDNRSSDLLSTNIVGLKVVERSNYNALIMNNGPQEEVASSDGGNQMSRGGIAGLVIGMLVLVVLLAAIVVRQRRKRQDEHSVSKSVAMASVTEVPSGDSGNGAAMEDGGDGDAGFEVGLIACGCIPSWGEEPNT